MLATEDPEIVPCVALATIAAFAGPPVEPPATARARSVSQSPIPVS